MSASITREQTATLRIVVIILAFVSLLNGSGAIHDDGINVFWFAVVPVLLVGALAFLENRPRDLAAEANANRAPEPEVEPKPPTSLNHLERLAKLHHDGALSKEEFEAEKRRILEA